MPLEATARHLAKAVPDAGPRSIRGHFSYINPKTRRPPAWVSADPSRSIQLDLHVDAGGKLELHQRIDRLVGRIEDVHQTLVGAQLELVACILIGVRRHQQGEALHLGRQRHGTAHRRARALGGLDDFPRRAVDQPVVEGFETNANVLVGHGAPYFMILATTPAPTVLPPSRMAKRSPSSIAIGLISSTVILMLSPGMIISVPAGNSIAPVTSVVRK